MTIQTVEIGGQRYVILPERDFLAMQKDATVVSHPVSKNVRKAFRDVKPVSVAGVPTSEMLIRDRR